VPELDGGRRAARRSQTIDEILSIAVELMGEYGVAGLSLSEVARRLGIQPPSLYKYFPSRLALYDRAFHDGHQRHLAEFRAGAATAAPGLAALSAALEASGRWVLANPALAQLMFWRPVPGFEPSAEAYAPSLSMVDDVRRMLHDAVAAGELRSGAASEEGARMMSILATGVLSQQLANAPDEPFDSGRYIRLFPQAIDMFRLYYAPTEEHHADRPPGGRPRSTHSAARGRRLRG
jgi:AcrR family transcriptional regulator